MTIRDEINQIIKVKGIASDDFQLVSMHHYQQVERKIIEVFVENDSIHWANMGNYKAEVDCSGFNSMGDFSWVEQLPHFLHSPDDSLYFALEDTKNYGSKYWYYEGNMQSFIRILAALPYLDYYIVSKKMTFLISENHHGYVTFVGTGFKLQRIEKYFNTLTQ